VVLAIAELTYHAASPDAATWRHVRFGCYRVPCESAFDTMRPVLNTLVLLTISNVFMTFAWYAHLRELSHKPWIVAALISWGIALFEYLFQVPANRIGFTVMSVSQLKILQEVITLTVFVPFAWLYLKEPIKLDYLWAGLCVLGAVYFIFRGR
jgi:uncharacterized protein (DUF486 family)